MRPITVARVEGDQSVIASGLMPGDVVVTDGQLRLTPNVRVAQRGGGAGDPGGRASGNRGNGARQGQGRATSAPAPEGASR
jgi:hypothetical protein